jgi:hypothetical protein
MLDIGSAGNLLGWPLRTGASDPVGILLTIALVVFVNIVIYVLKKVWG